ncbi:MAG: TonB-dependent siderophore receptor [Solimonas sp.]
MNRQPGLAARVAPLFAVLLAFDAGAQDSRGSEAAAPGPAAVEEIVVTAAKTATKTDTPLIETPQAISVITADRYTDQGALNFQETLRYSAGVYGEAYGLDTRADGSLIRGFTPAQYLDSMTRLFGYSLIPRADVYALDRVEVLRGPSSMLYGAGTAAGIVNMISKRPLFEHKGEFALQLGNNARRQLQFDVGDTLDDAGTFAGRFVGLSRNADLQTDHLPDDRQLAAPSLSWRPDAQTQVTLLALFQKDRTASSQQFLPVAGTLNAPPGRRLPDSRLLGEPDADHLDSEQTNVSLLAERQLNDIVKLGTAIRYARARADFTEIYPDVYSDPQNPFIDAERRILNRAAYATKSQTRAITNDNNAQFDFATGPFTHRLLVGLDYWHFKQNSMSGSDDAGPIDAYAPVYGHYTLPELFDDPTLSQSQIGVYLQDQVRWGERTTLVAGVRRDRAESHSQGSEEQIDDATTARVGVVVDVGAGFSPYVSYSESFLPVVGLDFYGNAFVPERGRQYEAGVKWQPASATLVTLTAYDIVGRNRQTNDPNNVLNTIQTGRVKSRGVELEATQSVTRSFYITANYSYTDAEVTQSSFAEEVGVQLSDVPQQLASVWGVKTVGLGDRAALRLGAGVRYVGSTLSTAESGSLKTPDYTLADALAAIDWQAWSLSLNATNVFDHRYYAPCRAFGDCFVGNRRSVIGTLGYQF